MVKSNTHRAIKLIDLAILLYHVHKGAEDQEIGFEDARESLESLTTQLNKTVYIKEAHIESALWSANLMDEKRTFWHPKLDFNSWVKSIVGTDGFNRFYNLIGEK